MRLKQTNKDLPSGLPVLSIESTILTHGLPLSYSKKLIKKVFSVAEKGGVYPAFVSVQSGRICVGSEEKILLNMLKHPKLKKISYRNLGIALSKGWTGGTTVSASISLAKRAGISVFCTGGIGGVHRDFSRSFDVSQDVLSLSKTPIIVIASGAKAILDLKKTLEALEFFGIPVVGYQTDEFPAFWSRSSGLSLELNVSDPKEIVSIWNNHIKAGNTSAVLVVNPVPKNREISNVETEKTIQAAIAQAAESGVSGGRVTPFVLDLINGQEGGRYLESNMSLALNNISLGVDVASLV